MYFTAERQRIEGRSAALAAALEALADGPMRASDVGTRIRGTTVRSLERLGDIVSKLPHPAR